MKKYFENDKNWQQFKEILFSWEGTPYRHMQMVKGRGADCTLFVGAVWKEVGLLKDVVFEYYDPKWCFKTKEERVLKSIFQHSQYYAKEGVVLTRHKKDEPLFRGDLVVFATTRTGLTNHAGVYLGENKIIHAVPKRGVSTYTINDSWRERMTAFFRVEVL